MQVSRRPQLLHILLTKNKQKITSHQALRKVQIYVYNAQKYMYVWRPGSGPTRWGSLQRSPDTQAHPSWISGSYF